MYTRSSGISYVSLRTYSAPSISSFLAFLVSPDGPKIVTTGMASSPLRAVAAPLLAPKLPSRPYAVQGASERSQVAHKQIRLLHRREVTAALELAPVHDVRERLLGETPNGEDDIVREDRHPQRHRERRRRRRPHGGNWQQFGGLHVDLSRRSGGGRQPVDRHIGQQLVAVNRFFGNLRRVGPLAEFLDDPSELADQRIGQPIRQ